MEAGNFFLEDSIFVSDQYLRWGWSPITNKVQKEGPVYYTFKELLEKMVLVSDNTACDILIEKTGGPSAITRTLRNFGIREIRIDRTEHEIHTDLHLINKNQLGQYSFKEFTEVLANIPEAKLKKGFNKFIRDPRDTSTPLAMVHLMNKFINGELLNYTHTDYLKQLMIEAPVRNSLIKAGYPKILL